MADAFIQEMFPSVHASFFTLDAGNVQGVKAPLKECTLHKKKVINVENTINYARQTLFLRGCTKFTIVLHRHFSRCKYVTLSMRLQIPQLTLILRTKPYRKIALTSEWSVYHLTNDFGGFHLGCKMLFLSA